MRSISHCIVMPPHKKGKKSEVHEKRKEIEVISSYESWVEYLASGKERKNFCHVTHIISCGSRRGARGAAPPYF